MVPTLVRPLRPEEWRALREVRLRALRDAPLAFERSFDEDAARPDEHFVQWAARPGTFVAEREGTLVGLVATYPDEGGLGVGSMWVAPEARGGGVGRLLLEAALAWAREAGGHAEASLWVNEDNPSALRLYGSCGFRPSGVSEPQRWRPELRVLRLVRRL